MTHRAVMNRLRILIFYKYTFAIQVSIFGTFFLDEVHFSWLKVFWADKSKRSHRKHNYREILIVSNDCNYESILLVVVIMCGYDTNIRFEFGPFIHTVDG